MQYRKVLLWWILTQEDHPALGDEEKDMEALAPLVGTLFPGAEFRGRFEFFDLLANFMAPALVKLFPDLLTTTANEIAANEMLEVPTVLPCFDEKEYQCKEGLQWKDSLKWRLEFRDFLMFFERSNVA